jgi:hypothetical protein
LLEQRAFLSHIMDNGATTSSCNNAMPTSSGINAMSTSSGDNGVTTSSWDNAALAVEPADGWCRKRDFPQ